MQRREREQKRRKRKENFELALISALSFSLCLHLAPSNFQEQHRQTHQVEETGSLGTSKRLDVTHAGLGRVVDPDLLARRSRRVVKEIVMGSNDERTLSGRHDGVGQVAS